jgi:CheY-like chemotaxis protein
MSTTAPAILVVDDDTADRIWLTNSLRGAGYAVAAAATGADALVRCATERFAAITLDLLLPDMTGRDVLQQLRVGGLNRDTPVIIVSVLPEVGVALASHVQEILSKPVMPDQLRGALERAGVGSDSTRPVLVIDDDPTSLRLVESTLGADGYRAICVPDPKQGLELALEAPPAAIVLDLMMPGMDGFEFLTRFRATAHGRTVPVIVWTSKDLSPDERDLLRSAAQGIVTKGRGASALIDEIRVHAPLTRRSAA